MNRAAKGSDIEERSANGSGVSDSGRIALLAGTWPDLGFRGGNLRT